MAHVVEWRQVGVYAALTHFVWPRRINLVLADPKKRWAKACAHVTKCEWCALNRALTSALISRCNLVLRQKAEVQAAVLRVEVEALRRTRDDLQQRLGVAEAQVRSLTSTFTAQHAGLQSQGSGRSGCQ